MAGDRRVSDCERRARDGEQRSACDGADHSARRTQQNFHSMPNRLLLCAASNVESMHTFQVSAYRKWTCAVLGAACLALNTAGSASANPAPVSAQAQAAGLVDVLSV